MFGATGGGAVCRFKVTSVSQTSGRTVQGTKLAPTWQAPQRPNLYTAEISKEVPNTESLVIFSEFHAG